MIIYNFSIHLNWSLESGTVLLEAKDGKYEPLRKRMCESRMDVTESRTTNEDSEEF